MKMKPSLRGVKRRSNPASAKRLWIASLALAMTLFAFMPARAADITSNLIGHWTLDDTSGTSANDSTANNNDGTMGGGLSASSNSVSGVRGTALEFDGTDDYIQVPSSSVFNIGGTQPVTVSLWVKLRSVPAVGQVMTLLTFTDIGQTSSTNYDKTIDVDEDLNASFWVYDGAKNISYDPTPLTLNKWYHLVGTYDGANVYFYVNGVQQAAAASTASQGGSQIPVAGFISSAGWSTAKDNFDGEMDDIRIYNRALSAADVEALYDNWTPGKIKYNTIWHDIEYYDGNMWLPTGRATYTPMGGSFLTSNGSTNYFSRTSNLSGIADGKTLTGSFWFRRSGLNNGTREMIYVMNNSGTASDANSRFRIEFAADNTIEILGKVDGTTTVLDAKTGTAFTDTNWHHVMFSFDLANAGGRYIYVDGSSSLAGSPSTHTNNTIDFAMATPRNSIGGRHGGTNPYYGELADFWLDFGTYLDLSNSGNRVKFYNNGPVYLGPTGSYALGVAPDIFFSYDIENPNDTWIENQGDGGAFTLNTYIDTSLGPTGFTPNGVPQPYAVQYGTISAGGTHSCGIREDGILMCWGYTSNGVGTGDTSTYNVPAAIYGNGHWKQVTSGTDYSCGIRDDGYAFCWGAASVGQLGINDGTGRIYPQWVDENGPWKMIEAGDNHACGVKEDGTGWCWGQNSNGEVGDGTTTNVFDPYQLPGQWLQISASWHNTCGLKTDNTIWCWGERQYGTIGDGGSLVGGQATPVQISDPGPWIQVSAGGSSACGIKADGTGWCWGARDGGHLGDGGASTGVQNTPVQISGGGTWQYIHAGMNAHACGIQTDGTGWCWGLDDHGQLGDSSGDDTSNVPLQISGGGTWASISAGESHTCGIKSTGVGYCWGIDGNENLGNGAGTTDQFTPATISGSYTWAFNPTTGCTNPGRAAGTVLYNTTSNQMQFCNGKDWIAMGPPGPGGAGCSSPSGNEGAMIFNTTYNRLQYCNGANWVQIGKGAYTASVSGLIGYWKLDETAGTTAADSSGSGYNGTMEGGLTGADTGPGKFGTSLHFDGTNTTKILADTQDNMTSFTICTWFNLDSFSNADNDSELTLFNKSWEFLIDTTTHKLYFTIPTSSSYPVATSSTTIASGTWYHTCAVNRGIAMAPQIYVNGTDVSSGASGGNGSQSNDSPLALYIGSYTNEYAGNFPGYIDDVRVYNRVLSPAEIQELYYATGGP